MSVWYAIPSVRPNGGTAPLWKDRGYKVALYLDPPPKHERSVFDLYCFAPDGYPGYARAVNYLAKRILEIDPAAEWIVSGGDDIEPDPNHAPGEIAKQCAAHFFVEATPEQAARYRTHHPGTFGVMQPTGDRFAHGSIDRIAGSPWMGREWCRRAHGGQGPLWPEFTHMFVDEALQRVAEKLGVFWQRPDLVHLHRHFMRKSDDLNSVAIARPIPQHLKYWNSQKHWDESKAILDRLAAQDFAPCMPLD